MITVREAVRSDVPHLIRFQQNMASETEGLTLNASVLEQGVLALFDDPGKGKYYIAEENAQVAGCLMTTYEWSDWRCGTVLWIQSVYIDKAHRGKGVYRKLYEYIQGLVTPESGYRGIRLYVDRTNTDAQKVYETLGMNGSHYQVFEWMP